MEPLDDMKIGLVLVDDVEVICWLWWLGLTLL